MTTPSRRSIHHTSTFILLSSYQTLHHNESRSPRLSGHHGPHKSISPHQLCQTETWNAKGSFAGVGGTQRRGYITNAIASMDLLNHRWLCKPIRPNNQLSYHGAAKRQDLRRHEGKQQQHYKERGGVTIPPIGENCALNCILQVNPEFTPYLTHGAIVWIINAIARYLTINYPGNERNLQPIPMRPRSSTDHLWRDSRKPCAFHITRQKRPSHLDQHKCRGNDEFCLAQSLIDCALLHCMQNVLGIRVLSHSPFSNMPLLLLF